MIFLDKSMDIRINFGDALSKMVLTMSHLLPSRANFAGFLPARA